MAVVVAVHKHVATDRSDLRPDGCFGRWDPMRVARRPSALVLGVLLVYPRGSVRQVEVAEFKEEQELRDWLKKRTPAFLLRAEDAPAHVGDRGRQSQWASAFQL